MFARLLASLTLALAPALYAPAQDDPAAKAVADKAAAKLAAVRKELAADPAGRRVRVDGFAADKKRVVVTGVVLARGATAADQKDQVEAAHKKIEAAVQKVTGDTAVTDFAYPDALPGDQMPNVLLQVEAAKAGGPADELKLDDAWFDADGRLVLGGFRGKRPETEKWLAAAVGTVLAKHPAAARPGGKPDVVLDKLTAVAWPLAPAAVQAELHKAGLTRFRVGRVANEVKPGAVTKDDPAGQGWTVGVSGLTLGTAAPTAAEEAGLTDVLEKAGAAVGLGRKTATVALGLTADTSRVPDPAAAIQKVVATRPELDGVRVDARSGFGPDGRLTLAGLEPGLGAAGTAALGKAAVDAATGSDADPGWRRLVDGGVSVAGLERVKVRELLADLRTWLAGSPFDDVRLARLHFDGDGRLTLAAEAPDAAAVEAAVRKEFAVRAGKAVPAAKDPAPAATFAALPGSLTRHLQTVTTEDRKWSALLVERGFFNEKNEYTVRGVADSEGQKKAFAGYLAGLKGDAAWKAYFAPTPPAAPDLEVIPMGKLVERVRRVAPADPTFDGIRVTAARYEASADPKAPGQTLVFDAQMVGRPDPAAAAKLRELIATDPGYYGRRLPKGRPVVLRPVDAAQVPSAETGALGAGVGAGHLAKGDAAKARDWVDAAVLHNPNDAAAWFLSAYANHLAGDVELVRRDLYRVIELEGALGFDGGPQRKRRYAAAKDLQGPRRDELEKRWLELWKEYQEKPRRITFPEPK
ncbi:MAG: hypothetical protein C0501_13585 [Isosphaera sp.]|nr:hypothetical protein [Isosphaera sp.]